VLPPLGTPPPLVMPTKKVNNPKLVEVVEPMVVDPYWLRRYNVEDAVESKWAALKRYVAAVKVEVVESKPVAAAVESEEPILGKRKFTPRMNWADMCDSDSDDE
tara:strand:- start:49 stop:360 length:312 start_codon:yes stop_codon:yes gene_type:complete